MLHSATDLLDRADTGSVRIGGTDYSRRGDFYLQMSSMLQDLEATLELSEIAPDLLKAPYHVIARQIASGSQEG